MKFLKPFFGEISPWELCVWVVLGAVLTTGLAWPLANKKYLVGGDLEINVLTKATKDGWPPPFLTNLEDPQKIIKWYRKEGLFCVIILNFLIFCFLILNKDSSKRFDLFEPTVGAIAASVGALSYSQICTISSTAEKAALIGAVLGGIATQYFEIAYARKSSRTHNCLCLVYFVLGLILLVVNKPAAFVYYTLFFCIALKNQSTSKQNFSRLASNCLVISPLIFFISLNYLPLKIISLKLWEGYALAIWVIFLIISLLENPKKQTAICFSVVCIFLILGSFSQDRSIGFFSLIMTSVCIIRNIDFISTNPFNKWTSLFITISLSIGLMLDNIKKINDVSDQQTGISNYILIWLNKHKNIEFQINSFSNLKGAKGHLSPKILQNLFDVFGLKKFKTLESNGDNIKFTFNDQKNPRLKNNPVLLNAFFGGNHLNLYRSELEPIENKINESRLYTLKVFGLKLLDIKIRVGRNRNSCLETFSEIEGARIGGKKIPLHFLFYSLFDLQKKQTLKYTQIKSELRYHQESQLEFDSKTKQCEIVNLKKSVDSKKIKPNLIPFADPLALLPMIGLDLQNGTLQQIYAYSETGKVNLIYILVTRYEGNPENGNAAFSITLVPLLDQASVYLNLSKAIDSSKKAEISIIFEDSLPKEIKGHFKGLPFTISQNRSDN